MHLIFLNGEYLWALPLCLLPVLLLYWRRPRPRTILFGAMRILLLAVRQTQAAFAWQDRLQLACRIGLLAALILSLAGPVLHWRPKYSGGLRPPLLRGVLLVDGRDSGRRMLPEDDVYVKYGPDDSAADYIQAALEVCDVPVQRIPSSVLAQENLADWNTVVLCDVAAPADLVRGKLRAFQRQGSGLIFVFGARTRPDAWNAFLASLRLGVQVEPVCQNEHPGLLDPHGYAHPILRIFADEPDSGLLSQTVRYYFPVRGALAELSLPTGEALLAVSGNVVFWSVAPEMAMTDASTRPGFVPLWNETVRYASTVGPPETHLSLICILLALAALGLVLDVAISIKNSERR